MRVSKRALCLLLENPLTLTSCCVAGSCGRAPPLYCLKSTNVQGRCWRRTSSLCFLILVSCLVCPLSTQQPVYVGAVIFCRWGLCKRTHCSHSASHTPSSESGAWLPFVGWTSDRDAMVCFPESIFGRTCVPFSFLTHPIDCWDFPLCASVKRKPNMIPPVHVNLKRRCDRNLAVFRWFPWKIAREGHAQSKQQKLFHCCGRANTTLSSWKRRSRSTGHSRPPCRTWCPWLCPSLRPHC